MHKIVKFWHTENFQFSLYKFTMKTKRGISEKRLSYLVLSLISIILIAVSVNAGITSDSAPTIRLTFDEEINLNTIIAEVHCANEFGICYDNFGAGIVLERYNGINISLENSDKTVVYDLDVLINDYYVLETTVEDLFGNAAPINYDFQVDADYMNIYIIEPENGWSSSETFDVIIAPEENAVCWYSPGHTIVPSSPEVDVYFDENYTESGNIYYKIIDATSKHSSYASNNQLPLYIACYTNEGLYGLEQITIHWDTTAPDVTYEADPNPLTDLSFPYVMLNAVASNDEIGCQVRTLIYDNENVPNPNFVDFDDIDFYDIITYNRTNTHLLDFENIRYGPYRYDPHNFQYEVKCRNKAGLYDENHIIDLVVQFSDQFSIEQINPLYNGYVNYPNVDVQIRSQVLTDWCNISKEGEFNLAMGQDPNQRDYSYIIPELAEGSHVYDIQCFSSFGSLSNKEIKFGIDMTDPYNLSIDTGLYTCSLNKIEFIMLANDDLSGIDHFNYTILGPDLEVLETGETISTVIYSASLIENSTYTISGYAFDRAGNSATFATRTISATNDGLTECDSNPPSIDFDLTEESGLTIVDITCSDSETGCQDSFEYSLLTETSNDCSYDTVGYWDTNNQFLFSEETKICVLAYDNNNNEIKADRIITIDEITTDHCLNGVQDLDETDIDCGGFECGRCDLDSVCVNNSDCLSEWCYNNICISPACDDFVLNGDETDLDCGGSCDSCSENSSCLVNEDCNTMWCDSEICTKSSCSDGVFNGFESDIDCGGVDCSGCPNGFECSDHSDCLSGYCDYGICSEEMISDEPITGKTKETNMFALILLIVGILLILGGTGYLVYDHYYIQPLSRTESTPSLKDTVTSPRLSQEQIIALKKKRDLMKSKFKQKSRSTKSKISSSLSSFDDEFVDNEKDMDKIKKAIIKDVPKEEKKKKTPGRKERLDKNLKGDFVDLDDLSKNAKKEKIKKVEAKKQAKPETIFDRLEKIKTASKKVFSKQQDSKSNTKTYLSEEDFKKLDLLMGKAIKSSAKQISKDSIPRPTKNKQEIDERKEDIFAALSDLANKSSTSKTASSQNKLFESNDLVDLFKDKELDINVFKVILSELLRTNKLGKKEVSNIIFKLLEKDLIKKDVAHTVLNDLNLVNE